MELEAWQWEELGIDGVTWPRVISEVMESMEREREIEMGERGRERGAKWGALGEFKGPN